MRDGRLQSVRVQVETAQVRARAQALRDPTAEAVAVRTEVFEGGEPVEVGRERAGQVVVPNVHEDEGGALAQRGGQGACAYGAAAAQWVVGRCRRAQHGRITQDENEKTLNAGLEACETDRQREADT